MVVLRPGAKPPFGGLAVLSDLTPMKRREWRAMMRETGYREVQPARYRMILDGLTEGVNIGYIGPRETSRDAKNQGSATACP